MIKFTSCIFKARLGGEKSWRDVNMHKGYYCRRGVCNLSNVNNAIFAFSGSFHTSMPKIALAALPLDLPIPYVTVKQNIHTGLTSAKSPILI